MKINPKLRQDLIKYNLNFPTDARTKEYKSEVATNYKGSPELYKIALQSKVAIEKSKQKEADKKEKKEPTRLRPVHPFLQIQSIHTAQHFHTQ